MSTAGAVSKTGTRWFFPFRKGLWPVSLAIWVLWTYLLLALSDTSFIGVSFSLKKAAAVSVLSAALVYVLVAAFEQRHILSYLKLKQLALACSIALASIMVIDLAYSIYLQSTNAEVSFEPGQFEYSRLSDNHIWTGEFQPEGYFPTERNFQLHKPNRTLSATTFGQMYTPNFLNSPVLLESVLEPKQQIISIDEHGFRDTSPLEDSRVFALGDSYVEGVNVSQENTWVEVLEQRLEQPVYNLGKSATSPRQHLMILEHVLEQQGSSMQIDYLLWMIFEGNDLEESYRVSRPADRSSQEPVFSNTVLESLASAPTYIRHSSVINRALTGRLINPQKNQKDAEHYTVDGLELESPLYHSQLHDYKMFDRTYLERATLPSKYVESHRNRVALEQTFSDMLELSQSRGFDVVVVIAPSAPRLYAPYFEDFPVVSEEPYFINFVADLAASNDFQVVNLYSAMQPYAASELLYARDDTHWNERGNALAAQVIAAQVFGK